jgi:hypothetical protein
MGLIRRLQGTGEQQAKDQLIMEAYNWGSGGSLVVKVRNTRAMTLILAGVTSTLVGYNRHHLP